MKTRIYPVENFRKIGNYEWEISAGIRGKDSLNRLTYEGISFTFHKDLEEGNHVEEWEEIDFAVVALSREREKVILHSTCRRVSDDEYYADITIDYNMFNKITGLTQGDIDNAWGKIHLGYTYRVMQHLPRIIKVTKDKIQLEFGKISESYLLSDHDAYNICNNIAGHLHPIDRL